MDTFHLHTLPTLSQTQHSFHIHFIMLGGERTFPKVEHTHTHTDSFPTFFTTYASFTTTTTDLTHSNFQTLEAEPERTFSVTKTAAACAAAAVIDLSFVVVVVVPFRGDNFLQQYTPHYRPGIIDTDHTDITFSGDYLHCDNSDDTPAMTQSCSYYFPSSPPICSNSSIK